MGSINRGVRLPGGPNFVHWCLIFLGAHKVTFTELNILSWRIYSGKIHGKLE